MEEIKQKQMMLAKYKHGQKNKEATLSDNSGLDGNSKQAYDDLEADPAQLEIKNLASKYIYCSILSLTMV